MVHPSSRFCKQGWKIFLRLEVLVFERMTQVASTAGEPFCERFLYNYSGRSHASFASATEPFFERCETSSMFWLVVCCSWITIITRSSSGWCLGKTSCPRYFL